MLVSMGYLYFGIMDLLKHFSSIGVDPSEESSSNTLSHSSHGKDNSSTDSLSDESSCSTISLRLTLFVVFLMAFFHLTYATLEGIFGIYLTPFAVKCSLHLSRQSGAHLSATFWGAFTAGRFASIFVSSYVSPAGKIDFSRIRYS